MKRGDLFLLNGAYLLLLLTPANGQESESATLTRFRYEFTQMTESGMIRKDTMDLDISDQLSVFYDATKERKAQDLRIATPKIRRMTVQKNLDADLLARLERIGPNDTRIAMYDEISFSVYKDRAHERVVTTDVHAPFKILYAESLSSQDWEISPVDSTVVGYACQRATTVFRGRSYLAWFSPDIPIPEGPWKFSGLPGMILKVVSLDGQVGFEAIGIEIAEGATPIEMPDESEYEKCRSLQQFYDFQKAMSKDRAIGIIDSQGNAVMTRDFEAITPVQIETEF